MFERTSQESGSADGAGGAGRTTPDGAARHAGSGVAETHDHHGRRGQTTLDFAVGVSLFLIVFISVFIFVPGTLQPFAEGGQEEIVSANRVADSLSESVLGDPATPHVLNTTCTVSFFKGNTTKGCAFGGGDVSERIGVNDRQFANVRLLSDLDGDGDDAVLCWDSDGDSGAGQFVEGSPDCDSGEIRLEAGGNPPQGSGTAVQARRIVQIRETNATLIVELW